MDCCLQVDPSIKLWNCKFNHFVGIIIWIFCIHITEYKLQILHRKHHQRIIQTKLLNLPRHSSINFILQCWNLIKGSTIYHSHWVIYYNNMKRVNCNHRPACAQLIQEWVYESSDSVIPWPTMVIIYNSTKCWPVIGLDPATMV